MSFRLTKWCMLIAWMTVPLVMSKAGWIEVPIQRSSCCELADRCVSVQSKLGYMRGSCRPTLYVI